MAIEQPPCDYDASNEGETGVDSVNMMSGVVRILPSVFNFNSISGIRRRDEQSSSPVAQSNVVQLVLDSSNKSVVRDVFETVRVIELSRLRLSLKRKRAAWLKDVEGAAPFSMAKSELLSLLETLHKNPHNEWPEVVVVRRAQRNDIQTNHAVVAGMIYLGAHLSDDWTEGEEGERFFVSLREALLDFKRSKMSRFEPSMSHY